MSNPNENSGGDSSWNGRRHPLTDNRNRNKDNDVPRCNDVYYISGNYHAAQANVQVMPENYTVRPVGHGNFLKNFPSNENDPPTFNRYELFSSSSFIPHHSMRPQAVGSIASDQNGNMQNTEKTTNTIINQLVTNWSPNISGTYSPFGEQQHSTSAHIFSPPVEECIKAETPLCSQFNQNDGHLINNYMSTGANKTNGNFDNSPCRNLPEVKKRIVAEVKPMRMSYSDVLSKNVVTNSNDSNGNPNSPAYGNDNINQSNKSTKFVYEKGKIGPNINTASEKKNNTSSTDERELRAKKVDVSNYKSDDGSQNSLSNIQQKDKKKIEDNLRDGVTNSGNKTKKASQSMKNKAKTQHSSMENPKKRTNRCETSDDMFTRKNTKDNEKDQFYNVTKNDNSFEKQQKSAQHNTFANSKKSKTGNTSQKTNSFRSEKQNFYAKRYQKPRKNDKYEMLTKFAEKWWELMKKIMIWFFYLVYDVIFLGFGMVYERLKHWYSCLVSLLIIVRTEFRNNSGKPTAWIKNMCHKFDQKFAKNSKWAFWRRFYKKKQPEFDGDFYKSGRLPQTGEEAMYSLLNCKGKDAYSILSVSADCSQEQIRKHYKKIAVLVHPDKNKQAGAEEAFKVLQRAFELIGEPENRRIYNQNLAEALNAEKAWTELHDLLSQLQSKIAEAANTIRCSSCGLRHPRKLTQRRQYAARECNSCKIKHSAREGDIWAETSMFGLRWKYLALMEGKVYDITEWANCQKGALSHLQPNSHVVQYRIVKGGQQQQSQEKEKFKKEPPSEPSLNDFLDNLYSGQNRQSQPQSSTSRRRSKKN